MNIAKINGFNSVNSNQNSKKSQSNPNFGLFFLADVEAGETLVEKIIDHGNLTYVKKLVDLIILSKNKKEIIYISSKDTAKVYNEAGVEICPTKDLNWFGALYMALENVVGKSTKITEPQNPKPETIGEIAQRLVDVLKDCPKVRNISDLFNNPPAPVTDPVSGAIKKVAA